MSFLLLTACENGHKPVPMEDSWNKVNSSQRSYTVQPGDTIYSIAWKFAKNYRQLAAYNHLTAPYTVTPGQRLRLNPKSNEPTPVVKASSLKTAVPVAVAKTEAPATPVTPTPVGGTGQWSWPVKGTIIESFGQGANKGIDIAVPVGTEVKAVDGGSVVYAGSNLHGYGQLVIVKHSSNLMTAYAHNSKLLVKEGGTVTQGQVIALSGDSEAPRAMLHFEVRQAGRPVNPLTFLK